MGWIADAAPEHEGWVANVLADGRVSASLASAGVIVDEQTDADIAAGYEVRRYPEPSASIDVVVPWDQVATWRIMCTCGWAGSEMPAHDVDSWRDCPEDIEDSVFLPEWQAHVAPFEALGQLGGLADQATVIERQLADKVQLARTAGASWSQIGREVGLSKQGAQQRWATA